MINKLKRVWRIINKPWFGKDMPKLRIFLFGMMVGCILSLATAMARAYYEAYHMGCQQVCFVDYRQSDAKDNIY